MSISTLLRSGLQGSKRWRLRPPTSSAWVRPVDWLPLPAVNIGDKKFVGLYAIFDNDFNVLPLSASNAYTVDWGDGTPPENVASSVIATHTYTYSSIPAETSTSEGFRQVIVTITPQGAGSLTAINISRKVVGSQDSQTSGWLDIRVASAAMSSFLLGSTSTLVVRHGLLERFEFVGPSLIASLVGHFIGCARLASVVGTTWTSSCIQFMNMFQSCARLRTIPALDTSNGTDFSNMFSACNSLESVPLLNTAKATSLLSMFTGCSNLKAIPLLDTSKCLTFSNFLSGCFALKQVPLFNTSVATNLTGMFNDCRALEEVPLLDTSKATSMSGLFTNCFSLRAVPQLNTSLNTTFASMFLNCFRLTTIPLIDTSKGTNFSNMFQNCFALQSVPPLNVAAATTLTGIFGSGGGTVSLSKAVLTGVKVSISYIQTRLSAAELNNVYTSLASGVVGQTITVTGNPGVGGDDPTIATAKGWTVVGS